MEDFLWSLRTVDSFTFYVLVALVGVVAWFIREIVGSTFLSVVSVPLLMLGGVVSYRCFQLAMITVSADKDANVVITAAAGVFIALLLLIFGAWLTAKTRENQSRKRRILPVTHSAHHR